jgi:AraC-like DNA-binding protein
MKTKLPLIRLSAANPLLAELQARSCDTRCLLRSFGLPTDVPASAELFISADTMYELVERCGEVATDPFFGFSVGKTLRVEAWGVMSVPAREAKTVGELLTKIALHTSEHSSSTEYYLKTQGARSSFGFRRAFRPAQRPAHNDAFYFGWLYRLLKLSVGGGWHANQVLFRVAAPENIPPGAEGCRLVEGDWLGVEITFPTDWLFEPFESDVALSQEGSGETRKVPRELIDSLRVALRPHLHDEHLTAAKAAKICGYDRRHLAKDLRERGTTISRELAALRAEQASQALTGTDRRIADIAADVGFNDPNVFSRAFKNWTGQSPRDYRRTHRPPS